MKLAFLLLLLSSTLVIAETIAETITPEKPQFVEVWEERSPSYRSTNHRMRIEIDLMAAGVKKIPAIGLGLYKGKSLYACVECILGPVVSRNVENPLPITKPQYAVTVPNDLIDGAKITFVLPDSVKGDSLIYVIRLKDWIGKTRK